MADVSVDLQASNLFGLNANFNTQSSSTTTGTQNVATNDESGNVSCQRNITEQTDYTQSATYCGFDFVGDLGTFLTEFGNFQTVGVVTQLTINMTAGDYCTVDITGHQHEENAHEAGLALGYADVSDFLPHETADWFYSWDGFGVPSVIPDESTNMTPSSATYTFTMNHIDTQDESGDHFTGKNITPRCEISSDFEGAGDTVTINNLQSILHLDATNSMLDVIIDSIASNDANSVFDTFSFTGHANTDLATA